MFFYTFVLLSIAQTCFGQWTKIMEWDSAGVAEIKFDEHSAKPQFGYISVADFNGYTTIYRTTDGGFNWVNVTPTKLSSSFLSLSIKDQKTAWAFGGWSVLMGAPGIKTVDGGMNWSELLVSDAFNGAYFISATNLLVANAGSSGLGAKGTRYISEDEGASWSINERHPDPWGVAGYAFADSMNGIEVGYYGPIDAPLTYRTRDGGRIWIPTAKGYEASWQPLAIKNTKIFLLASFYSSNILRSKDVGETWDTLYHSEGMRPSGTIVGDLCHLYVQSVYSETSTNDSIRGVFESTDQGKSWHKVADLIGNFRFRFYFYNNVLFVGDFRFDSDPPQPSSLWRYELPPNKPTMVGDDFTLSVPCGGAKDTSVMIAAVNHCDGEKVRLDTVYQTGSSVFTLPAFTTAKEIVTDTLHIHYQPQTATPDTAYIHLRYYLKGNTFDTVMTVIGTGGGKREEITFRSSLSPAVAVENSPVELLLTPDKPISNKNLSEIAFTLTYHGDVLDGITAETDISGATVALLPSSRSGRYTIQPIIITGTNMSLAPAIDAARLKFRVMLSDSTSSPLRISDVKLNTFDPDYERCTLSATSDTSNFNLQFLCGDSTLVKYLRNGAKSLLISSPHPNPTSGLVTVDVTSQIETTAEMEIYSILGERVKREAINIQKGTSPIHIDTKDLESGSYILRIASGDGAVSERFVVK